jgi:SPP1 gp7 family putative phage head morphogenesis protein
MKRKVALSEKKQAWLGSRTVTLQGTKLNYNASQQARVVKILRAAVERMADETRAAVMKLFESEISETFFNQQEQLAAMDESLSSKAKKTMRALMKRFQQLFDKTARTLADDIYEGSLKTSAATLGTSLKELSGGVSIKTNIIPEALREDVGVAIKSNVEDLIKTIPQQYFKNVNTLVMQSITTGTGVKELIPTLKELINKEKYKTDRHAKNLALDQTRKAYNAINKQRMLSVGIKKFMWLHSGGGQHPREDHIDMNGKIYSFDDPPVIDKRTGERGIPGDAINCKCTMKPVIEFDEGEEQ